MVLNKRERNIAIVAGAVLALLLLYFVAISPYLDARQTALAGIQASNLKLNDFKELKALKPDLDKKWTEMQNEGIEVDEPQAERQLSNAVLTWSDDYQIVVQSTNPPRSSAQDKRFTRIDWTITFDVQGNRGMDQIAKLMWAIESAPIPIRINDMIVKSVKDGTDQMNISLTVTALCMPPATTAAPQTGAPAAAQAGAT